MDQPNALREPPIVNGTPTTLHTFTHQELAHSPLLEPLFDLMNAAFAATHGSPYFPPPIKRFASVAQMLAEISTSATVYVLSQASSSGDVRLVGSVTDEPYAESYPASDAYDGDKTPDVFHPHLEGEAEHEDRRALRLLVTDPTLHRQGVGSWLMAFLEAQLIRRAEQERAAAKKLWTHVRWVLVTIAELNGAYYEHRGWRLIRSDPMPVGFVGTILPITVYTMDKLLVLAPVV